MDAKALAPGIQPGRLDKAGIEAGFSDLHPALDDHEALVAADRCYFCHDAPCATACPTDIDIPLFIRQIATGTPDAAARTILSQNILGGMCARVCPTETLCEEVCVRETAEGKPVEIGRLQRYATDTVMAQYVHPFERDALTGKRVAVVGAGPAGLSCAHRLAMMGHDVVIFDERPKPGGLNEYGIAAYKSTEDFAAREVDWLMGIGGIELKSGMALGRDLTLERLTAEYDAVFLGMGLGGVNALGVPGDDRDGVVDAVDFISELRQAPDLTTLPVGRNVVVIGGGMTAVDAAVQCRLLGARDVTIVYRRSQSRMAASRYEQELAQAKGVRIICNASPVAVHGNGTVREIEFAYTGDDLTPTGETFRLPADQVFRAIGQTLAGVGLPDLDGRKIAVDGTGRTSVKGVWAGGDCASGGDDLTVTAVAEGRDAAIDIHTRLMEQANG
ncbi:dihydropyrimidine dehydrogenase [Salipiger aestuarii]|uniref:NADPH-dependent glutamate synthase beta subunit-like oxidoreductase n=1 Tax=Salipiger aestuarii TaxID=568098 RepID=A0A327YA74_9RHOB|nr:NAD(P)-dependent oxidoreductase [Salipiger aestuarii]EIE49765.1 putative oxidoreductase [Citreicella sp. 357]KAA8607632.1 dihydropyrimidine dehydrogenase [Salipiger aestuarii]KAA8611093.1 dihydropyrimidine dehydrogenase [Salipiger aestuarii]KAB2541860.1 dihydropyrimidine dehydrogenase [Salipiger aestuarii]RAK15379.1 NADPH-dependent glutamate synthase beta subunit-like oxidoreductase [Salipiger aestuarii]